jgi:signal transduction histidine kinase/putative methionine-R-sulfoxide reductase with GAF domain
VEKQKLMARVEFLHDRVTLLEKRFRCIQTVAAAIGSSLHLDEVLHTVAEQVTAMLEAERSTVFLVETETGALVARTIIGPEHGELRLEPGQGVAGWVARTSKTVNVKDAYKDKRFDPSFDRASGFRTKSILCQPMVNYRGATVGVIQVINKLDRSYFTVEDEHLLSTITTQAAISIENSKYYTDLHEANLSLQEAQENMKRNYGRLETLYNIQNQMTLTWEAAPLIKGVLQEVTAAVPVGIGAILITDPAPATLYVWQRGVEGVEIHAPAMPGGVMGKVARDGKGARDGENGGGIWSIIHPLLDVDVSCLVAEPLLRADGESVGSICLGNRQGLLKFSAEDEQLVRIVARQVSNAMERLENHHKLTRENNLSLIGQALSGVLHDFKSPMGIISGYVQLMAEEEDPAKRGGHAKQVLSQFNHLNVMTQEVMAFARGETGLLKRNVYPTRFLKEMKEMLEQEFEGRPIDLEIDDRTRKKIKADEGKLKRLFFNVARNAREAMPDGGVFRIEAEDVEGGIEFRLSDTGEGIPESIRENVFQSFVTTGKKDGTGLGLAIVKKIVDQHGGTVHFESKSGAGTTFVIRLPRE